LNGEQLVCLCWLIHQQQLRVRYIVARQFYLQFVFCFVNQSVALVFILREWSNSWPAARLNQVAAGERGIFAKRLIRAIDF